MYVYYPDEGIEREINKNLLALVKRWISSYETGRWSKGAKDDPSLTLVLSLTKAYGMTAEELFSALKVTILDQMNRWGLHTSQVPCSADYRVDDVNGCHVITPRFRGGEGDTTFKPSFESKPRGYILRLEGPDNGGVSYQGDMKHCGTAMITIANETGRAFAMVMEYSMDKRYWVKGEASTQDGRHCKFGFMGIREEGSTELTMNTSGGLSVDAYYNEGVLVLVME